MATVVPVWLKGKHLTAITITPYASDTNGTLTVVTSTAGLQSGTATAAKSLSGYIDGITFRSSPMTEMILPVDQTVANYEITVEDYEVNLVEISHVKTNVWKPLLVEMFGGYDFFKVSFTRGSGTFDMYLKRGAYQEGVVNFGKNTNQLSFRPIRLNDTATATVTYTP